jgi:predicted ArsR family transcriptional regulator
MSIPTRQRILEHLQKHQTASVRELSRDLALTGANIRHHLAFLIAGDQVEVLRQRREQRGRPANLYSLSRRMLGDNLAGLTDALLNLWLQEMPEGQRTQALNSLAQRLSVFEGAEISGPAAQRLAAAIAGLNRLHYRARWEAAAAGPRVILGNCPYAAIIADHPELCRLDAHLLEQQLGVSVEQAAKLRHTSKGLPYCEFRVEQKI